MSEPDKKPIDEPVPEPGELELDAAAFDENDETIPFTAIGQDSEKIK
jgi:hypothetical protein